MYTVESAVIKLKSDKSAGADGIFAVHITYAHSLAILHVYYLIINITFWFKVKIHMHVPDALVSCIIVSVLKDTHGKVTSSDTSVTLNSVLSKVVELL